MVACCLWDQSAHELTLPASCTHLYDGHHTWARAWPDESSDDISGMLFSEMSGHEPRHFLPVVCTHCMISGHHTWTRAWQDASDISDIWF
jgi:hypothetical protein